MSESSPYHPFVLEVEAYKAYSWCTCGISQKQPFCDGSHGPTGMTPKIISFSEKKTVTWCGCKATRTPPFCDGSHKNISR